MISTNNYYNVGDRDNIVVSNSSLSHLNPQEGGSIISFLQFFDEKAEEKTSLALNRGKLIHKYIENPKLFVVADEEKPTDMMSSFLESVYLKADDFRKGMTYDVSTVINSGAKKEETKNAEILQAKANLEKISQFLELDLDTTIKVFRLARIASDAYSARHDPAVTNLLVEDISLKYLKFLLSTRDKIILTAEEKKKVDGAVTSLYMHPKVSALLGLGNNDFDQIVGETFSEVPIYWSESVTDPITGKNTTINCKALLDKVTINHDLRTITILDLKSTRHSIYLYQEAFEEYHTYRQLAKYNRAIKYWFNTMFPDRNFNEYSITSYVVPVETFGNYLTGIYHVSDLWLFKGRDEAKRLWQRLAWHIINKEFRYSPEEVLNKHIMQFTNPPRND